MKVKGVDKAAAVDAHVQHQSVKLTDRFVKDVDGVVQAKEKELMAV